MTLKNFRTTSAMTRSTLALTLLLSAAASHAAITAFNDSGSFLSTLSTSATDNLDDLPGENVWAISRNVGGFSYSVGSSQYYGVYEVKSHDNVFLVPGQASDWLIFEPTSASAFGGNFFGNSLVAFKPGKVMIRVLDSLGADETFEVTPTDMGSSSFFGVVSDGAISRFMVHAEQGWVPSYIGADNLVVGTVSAVPEPGAFTLALAGMALISGLAVRRRSLRVD